MGVKVVSKHFKANAQLLFFSSHLISNISTKISKTFSWQISYTIFTLIMARLNLFYDNLITLLLRIGQGFFSSFSKHTGQAVAQEPGSTQVMPNIRVHPQMMYK